MVIFNFEFYTRMFYAVCRWNFLNHMLRFINNRNNKGNAFALILKAKKEGTRVFDLLNYSSRVHVNLEFHQNKNFN